MRKGLQAKSFERALFDGDIDGPNWPVVNAETGIPSDPGTQEYGHTVLGRNVQEKGGFVLSMTVIDYQEPSFEPVHFGHADQDSRLRVGARKQF